MTQITKATEPLYSTLGGDADLGEIIDVFVEEMPDRVAALLGQFRASDWDGLRRTAHQLKGAAGSYGYLTISHLAGRLEETLCRGEPKSRVRDAVHALIATCKLARGGTPAQGVA
jgi:HPt (histidine-containing phosphotransfer) domain-containing protein